MGIAEARHRYCLSGSVSGIGVAIYEVNFCQVAWLNFSATML